MKRVARWGILGGMIALALISSASAAGAALFSIYTDRILARTAVGGMTVSNLSLEQANARILAGIDRLEKKPLTFKLERAKKALTLGELGVTINRPATLAQLINFSQLDFPLRVQTWREFFRQKSLPLVVTLDEARIKAVIEEQFGIQNSAADAALIVEKRGLIVRPAQIGRSFDLTRAVEEVRAYINGAGNSTITLAFSTSPPSISTQAAKTAKAQIEAALIPLTLTYEEITYTIPVADQYNLIAYEATEKRLNWRLDEKKLEEYLAKTIAKKVNVKMIPHTVQSNDGAVVFEGTNGQEVQVEELRKRILAAYEKKTANNPIEIPVKVIAFTQKTVDPEYEGGLYEGTYIYINLASQKLFVMEGNNKISEHIISSGKASLPTPKGTFYIKNKIPFAYSPLYKLWMKNWNALAKNPDGSGYEGYGIHGLPCFDRDCTQVEGESHLGRPVSHGCVRLGLDASQYFFEKIPIGTPVVIR